MKKDIFDAAAKDELIERSMKLTADTERLWGSLTSAEMLHHCSDVLKGTMFSKSAQKPDKLKQKITRFLMLNVIPKFPKGAKTPLQVDIKKSNITTHDIQTEQHEFADQVNAFFNFKGTISFSHPYFGNLTRKQWGILTWMHMDHHLRQFGV